jgi:hypothetical protein
MLDRHGFLGAEYKESPPKLPPETILVWGGEWGETDRCAKEKASR